MITKNFKKFSSAIMVMGEYADQITLPESIVDINGVQRGAVYFFNNLMMRSAFYNSNVISITNTSSSGCFLLVGTNNATPTENDYTINAIDTVTSVANQTITRVIDNDGQFAMQIKRTLKNTAEEDITIKELGLFRTIEYNNGREKANFLLAREVLGTPLIVPAGGNFTVSMIVKV